MPTDEEGMMARLTADVLGLGSAKVATGYPETAALGTVR